MTEPRIDVGFPEGSDLRMDPQTKGEQELLQRLRGFGEEIARDHPPIESLEWWTEQPPDAALYFKAVLTDGVFFKAAISPIMFEELLNEGPLNDFFEHMTRELSVRVDEWARGMHTPRAPDLLENVIAFREWNIDWDAKTLGPIGIGGAPWVAAEWQQAECRARGISMNAPYGHTAPHPSCQCGLYALHRLPDAAPQHYFNEDQPSKLWGVVQAKGRMEVHSNGIRAEHARPVMLCVPEPTMWVRLTSTGAGEQIDHPEKGAVPVEPTSAKAIRQLAKGLGLDAVSWKFVNTKAREYGQPVPVQFYPGREKN